MVNFWQSLPKPILILAPMDQVTDTAFRQIVALCGKPTVLFTEFTNVEGMDSPGKEHVEERLKFSKSEHPIIAQIWGKNPEKFYKAAQRVSELGFDGVDINMGCPDRQIVKKGCCGGLIANPSLAKEIIQATQEGAAASKRPIPVSVKTRIGFYKKITEEWVKILLEQNIDALTVHLRTVAQQSKVPAQWEEMSKVTQVRDDLKVDTVIIGNGDVKTLEEAHEKVKKYNIDGVMIGRGIFENVWLFNESKNPEAITPVEKFNILLKHIDLFISTWGDTKNFAIIRKFVKAYVNGFPGASDVRVKLMETETPEQLTKAVKELL